MAQSRSSPYRPLAFLALLATVAALYFAQEVLIPLALATILSFLLAPLVRWLEHWGLPRVPAVLLITVLLFGVLGGTGYIVVAQLFDLAGSLPQYRQNIRHKIEAVRRRGGSIATVSRTITEFNQEFSTTRPATAPASQPTGPPSPRRSAATQSSPPTTQPLQVDIYQRPPSALERLRTLLVPILGPLGRAVIVVVFVIFMLIQREDLRDRLIRLLGGEEGRLYITTQALDEAAQRIGHYLRMNLLVNLAYGAPIGVGLYFIGVPNAILWGLLAALLRFIPYVGVWIGAAMPVLLSLAVFDGWFYPLAVIGLFVTLELIIANGIEPWLYGASTGITPVAILVAAAFWAWLWGPIGLLLATPLTVCLVVLGKYVPHLEFLSILLSDEPVLQPESRFYQRLLAMDQEEVLDLAEESLEKSSLVEVFDRMVLPALHLAQVDRHRGRLDEEHYTFIMNSIKEMLEDLGAAWLEAQSQPSAKGEKAPTSRPAPEPAQPTPGQEQPIVWCIAARHAADEVACLMLEKVLADRGMRAQTIPAARLAGEMLEEVERSGVRVICLSALPPAAVNHARYLCLRLRARFPQLDLVVGLWGSADTPHGRTRLESAGANRIVTTLGEALQQIPSLQASAPSAEKPPTQPS